MDNNEKITTLHSNFHKIRNNSTLALETGKGDVYTFERDSYGVINLIYSFKQGDAYPSRERVGGEIKSEDGKTIFMSNIGSKIDISSGKIFDIPGYGEWKNMSIDESRSMLNHFEDQYYKELAQGSKYHNAKKTIDEYERGQDIPASEVNNARNVVKDFLSKKRYYLLILGSIGAFQLTEDSDNEDLLEMPNDTKMSPVEPTEVDESIGEEETKKEDKNPNDKFIESRLKIMGGSSIYVKLKPIARDNAIRKYGATPAVRNFNPGNLEDTGYGGKKVSGERFTRFSNPSEGLAALIGKIVNIQKGNSKVYSEYDTILEYIHKYAPPSENDSYAYAKRIAHELEVTLGTMLYELNPIDIALAHMKMEDRDSHKMYADLGLTRNSIRIS